MSQTLIAPTATEVEPQSVLRVLRYSAITFHLDMTKRDASVIPIGVMAEIYLPTVYALGLIARTELDTEELAQVSELAKPLVTKPFEYLADQFEKAWKTVTPGEALNHLATQHAYSALHFSVPQPLSLYLPAAAPRAMVRMNLGSALEDQMQRLLAPPAIPQTQVGPQEELFLLKAAAAAA
jgi:hypothetical protein